MAKTRSRNQTAQLLGMREGIAIPSDVAEPLKQLAKFDLWFVEERLREKALLTPKEITPAILEFRRFLALQLLGGERYPVPNDAVDVVWHAFLLFTQEYQQFCDKLGTGFIHHVPTTSRSRPRSAPKIPYQDLYMQYFTTDASTTPPGKTVEGAETAQDQVGSSRAEGSGRRRYDPYADGNCEGCVRS